MLCRIADLIVDVPAGGGLAPLCGEYLCDENEKADIVIDETIYHPEHYPASLSAEDVAYMESAYQFYTRLWHHDGMYLHASSVALDGYGYLFSGDCGAGKSTHTRLWLRTFGEKAEILNDDKPAIRIGEDGIFACGTPWSGKTDRNINKIVPIGGIGFLERSEENWIQRLQGKDVVNKLLKQTVRPPEMAEMDALLKYVDIVLKEVPVYRLGVNMTEDAARMAYEAMSE